MEIIVEVKNGILGNSEFWCGPADDIQKIPNVVARRLAVMVTKDGVARKDGMWHVRAA